MRIIKYIIFIVLNPMANRTYNYLFKVVMVGNANVGKSSIVLRFADGEFNENYITTIGVDFRFKSIEVNGNKVKLQIWDTAGQQKFRTITSSYYKGAQALFIIFDITDKGSFTDVTKFWFDEIKNHCTPETQLILIGNKSDLKQERAVTKQQIQKFMKEKNMEYIQTSAKESQNIDKAFRRISEILIKKQQEKQSSKSQQKKQSIEKQKVSTSKGKPTKSSMCC